MERGGSTRRTGCTTTLVKTPRAGRGHQVLAATLAREGMARRVLRGLRHASPPCGRREGRRTGLAIDPEQAGAPVGVGLSWKG